VISTAVLATKRVITVLPLSVGMSRKLIANPSLMLTLARTPTVITSGGGRSVAVGSGVSVGRGVTVFVGVAGFSVGVFVTGAAVSVAKLTDWVVAVISGDGVEDDSSVSSTSA
jgi:hypothetical protein